MEKMESLYEESIVIDACAPLASHGNEYVRYKKGKITAAAVTIPPTGGYLPETIKGITDWFERIKEDEDLIEVLCVDDIFRAKREGKMGVILAFQGTTHLQANLSLIEVYYKLGIRQMLLCYNTKNAIGDGCTEPGNGGLSIFGAKAIAEMNRLGIIVDLAHTGYRTTMEAMEVSQKPCIFSHGNAYGVHNSLRNLRDEQVIKVAKMGGTVGINGYPAFVSNKLKPSVNDFIDHIDYYVNLVGIDHVTLGIDYYECQSGVLPDERAMDIYNELISNGHWKKETYPAPPYYYPKEIELPEKLHNLVPAMKARGYADVDIRKILGENLIRVMKEVWK